MNTCRSCGAPILWRETHAGRRMPIDPEPVADGNVVIEGDIAEVLKAEHLARLGGDEFTVLLTDADPESAMKLAERLLRSLGQPFIDDRLVIDFVTPSIGIALFPQHAKQAESLIKAADIAMYEAKQQRNRACLYTPPELSTPT